MEGRGGNAKCQGVKKVKEGAELNAGWGRRRGKGGIGGDSRIEKEKKSDAADEKIHLL